MGDPACWMHLLDEEGRIPDPPGDESETERLPDIEASPTGSARPAG